MRGLIRLGPPALRERANDALERALYLASTQHETEAALEYAQRIDDGLSMKTSG